MKRSRLITALLLSLALTACLNDRKCGRDAIDDKVEALLSQMTLTEKIGQLNQLDGYIPQLESELREGKVGSVLNCPADRVNRLQHIAVDSSRLGIPLLMGRDVIHGFKTIFPIPLAQAASFNDALVEKGARIAAEEATSAGIRHTYSPMIDVTRDPRWGRIAEGYGEDAYLTSRMGVAVVKGYQGDDLTKPNTMAATAKHFAGYGMTESGRDYNICDVSEATLHDYIFPPFKAVADAGAATFMAAFNEVNGVPASGSKRLLNDVLRGEWGWRGMVISDYYSIEQMRIQGYVETLDEAAAVAVNAGMDMDMMSRVYYPNLLELVKNGTVKESVIDDAVRNVLRLKFKLGLFENPYLDENRAASVLYAPEHLQAAREIATESCVLLKNDNNVLPLADNVQSVAVIGPMANAPVEQLGTWCFDGEPDHCVTPLKAITDEYGERLKINYVPGLAYSRDKNENDFSAAGSAARKSDVVLLFVGEEAILSGEAKCRADLNLPGAQGKLVEEVAKAGKPVVLVVMAGRPLTIGKEVEKSAAVLYAFHGGTMAGPALADLLFGKVSPSGKLPVTFPKMVGQIPIYYNQKQTGRPPHDPVLLDDIPLEAKQTSLGFTSYWLDAGVDPLYPFGYGLSYTTFEYTKIQFSSPTMTLKDGRITIFCEVTNKGNRAAKETAQLYIQDIAATMTRPVKELKGYEKVSIEPGETAVVSFDITPDMLAFYHEDGKTYAEPGRFRAWIAPSSSLQGAVEGEFEIKE